MKVKTILVFVTFIVLLGFFPTKEGFASVTIHTVINTNNSGPGSLYQAIIDANIHPGSDTISFNIPTSDPNYDSSNGWWVISPTGLLPSLTDDETVIDGGLQEVNQGNTNPSGLELVIDGGSLGGSMSILAIVSDRNNILGLTIANAPGPGIRIVAGADNNVITNNYIGTDPNGSSAWGNKRGIEITSGAHHNVVDMNTISGNTLDGILITGTGTDYNKVRRSYIGLDATGNVPLPNQGEGVWITNGAQYNQIGDTSLTHPSCFDSQYRNWISANEMRGVYVSGSNTDNNYIGHNYIGIYKSGIGSTDSGNLQSGVMLENGPFSNFIMFNVISGNHKHGIFLTGTGTEENYVWGNIVGANPEGTSLIPNYNHGVAVYDGANNNSIGDTVHPCLEGKSNVIVGNGWSGVAIKNTQLNSILNNSIGLSDSSSSKNLGNKFHGIHIAGNSKCEIIWNEIAYNGVYAGGKSGIFVEGSLAAGNYIRLNSIHDNSGKGIELKDGGNDGVLPPTITSADCTHVSGTVNNYSQVDIYSDMNGEGEFYEANDWSHPTEGTFTITGSFRGPNITATATDQDHNTSEFSLPFNGACYTNYMPIIYENY